jgi:hypothetical protein
MGLSFALLKRAPNTFTNSTINFRISNAEGLRVSEKGVEQARDHNREWWELQQNADCLRESGLEGESFHLHCLSQFLEHSNFYYIPATFFCAFKDS